jgi:Ala-tRNA(Pro) deacylase
MWVNLAFRRIAIADDQLPLVRKDVQFIDRTGPRIRYSGQRRSAARPLLSAAAAAIIPAPMAITQEQLLGRLDELGIAHRTVTHPPVLTVEAAREHTGHLPGGHCKSLFLKDRKGRLWLLVCLDHRRIDMNRLAKAIGSARLSFGQPDLLQAALGVMPGAVTPFALINDRERHVQPLLDQAMLAQALLNYHPLTNAATTTIKATDLLKFLEACGHRPQILDLDATGIARPESA